MTAFVRWVLTVLFTGGLLTPPAVDNLEHAPEPQTPRGGQIEIQMDMAICAVAVEEAVGAYGNRHPHDYEGRLRTCLEAYAIGRKHGVHPLLLVSLSYEETALVPQPGTSDKGAQGPFQVMPHHNCPGRTAEGCDLGFAAIVVIKKYGLLHGCGAEASEAAGKARWQGWESFQQHAVSTPLCDNPDWVEILCHYNSGEKCYSSSRGYAKRVLRRWERLEVTHALIMQHAAEHSPSRLSMNQAGEASDGN